MMKSEHRCLTDTHTFEDLACWQAARRLRTQVALDWVRRLPYEERRRLADQFLRAARSTTANIAEGYGRYHYRDHYRFCAQARGSCFEVLDHMITAVDEELLPADLLVDSREAVNSTVRVLNGYMAYLRRQAENAEK